MRSGGRVVEGARLESEYTSKAYPGFESLPLRHLTISQGSTKRQEAISPKWSCPTNGGVVTGIDLTVPLITLHVEELNRAFKDRLVILFRDQKISVADHKRLAAHFGGAHVAPRTIPWRVPGHEEVTMIHADADSKFVPGEDGAQCWP